jgi:N-acyl-D-amino-acid deacylase
MDVYPYDSSSSDGNFVAVPPAPDVLHQIALKGGTQNIRILEHRRAEYVGKTYAELMQLRKLDEVQLAIALQREGARMRSFSMDERDIDTFFKLDWCAVSTDGWVVLPEEATGDKKYVDTNRRVFGSYPRRLGYFSKERGVDSLEHAVRASSGLPAQILNLPDRGLVAVGMKADIVVLDMSTLADNTTYLEPSVYPTGVEYVIVNGEFVVDAGKRTLALPGQVLRPAF